MKLHRKFSPVTCHRLLRLFVVLGICASLFPLPVARVPCNVPGKDDSAPFPCQNRPCGCMTAAQCWKKCCCFSNAQKIAWAKANHVQVPDFVIAAAEREEADHTKSETNREICQSPFRERSLQAPVNGSGCSHCRKQGPAVIRHSCCSKIVADSGTSRAKCGTCRKAGEDTPSESPKPVAAKYLLAISAAECQGQSPPVFCFPITIMSDCTELQERCDGLIERVTAESERLPLTSLRPPLPPPKVALVG